MYFKELLSYLDYNEQKFRHKNAIVDDKFQITWGELKSTLKKLEVNLRNSYAIKESKTLILLDGDYCTLHVLIIILCLLKGWIIVPKNRTLTRSDNDFKQAIEISINELSFTDLLKEPFEIQNNFETFSNEQEAVYYCTSGTTGLPKIIVSSNCNLIRGGIFVSEALGIKDTDVLGGTLSLDFDYGINQIICAIVSGATYVSMPYSSISNPWYEFISRYSVSIIPAMPFLIEKYFRIPGAIGSFPTVRLLTSSGAPFTDIHARSSERLFPNAEIVTMYGLSEGFRATILPPGQYLKFPNSVGFPIGNTVIKIINDSGNECDPYEIGEIVQSSGCLTWGYLNDVNSTMERFYQNPFTPARQWLKSGDLGYLDAEGRLYVKGRVSAQIKKFGIRISMDEIESAYKNSGKFQYVLAVPLENNQTESDFGLILGTNMKEKDIDIFIRSIQREFRPKKYVVTDNLIDNFNGGKPDRQKLKEKYFGEI